MTELVAILLRIFASTGIGHGTRIDLGETGHVRTTITIQKTAMVFHFSDPVGWRDASEKLHRVWAIRVSKGMAEFSLDGHSHWFAIEVPVPAKAIEWAYDLSSAEPSIWTKGKLVLHPTMHAVVSRDEDAISVVFADPKPIGDGPLNFDYKIDQAWLRTAGVQANSGGEKLFRKSWNELGVA